MTDLDLLDLSFNSQYCCGIKELDGIQGEDQYVPKAAEVVHFIREEGGCAFVQFNQATFLTEGREINSAGIRLARYIRKHKLGRVVTLPAAKNPNSGNKVKPFLWAVDWDALKKHCEKK